MSTANELALCKEGISAWQQAFNNQDAAGCAAQYTQDSVMEARPFGLFNGRSEIQAFWQGIIDQGFAEVEYLDVKWVEAEGGYLLSSRWTMNKAFGVVHRELWVIDRDGKARLADDLFEVQGER
ncbi:isochorismatase [Amphritea opalescens]|uniref:Isochorismatase n=1 Tax=Amphritea opalescens TaxID=2490544 RepID=A0A430KVP4_9GAMM|nr:nuclear transport factor 2 family protein [Amphritea opalescens]RTE67559.1 isochorismatase [Amphritea opalescens]